MKAARYLLLFLFGCWAAWSSRAATLPAGFTETLVASGISSPTAMAIAPDGRLFVCQQNGQLRVIKQGALQATPFLAVTTDPSGERGLLGVAFDPGFEVNQHVYIYYTVPGSPAHNRVSRFTANGDVAVPGSEVVILELNNLSSATNHNGGAIHFGPDGMLYIAVGDNANGSNAQSFSTLLGKILRLRPDGTIPSDNPFRSTTSGIYGAIWALGLRNPFTFDFEAGTGRMFINDVGQNTWEEINNGFAGANYGWPSCEARCSTVTPGYTDPVHQYANDSQTCAITGGAFYDPPVDLFPATYHGAYLFADYCAGWIRALDPVSGTVLTTLATGISNPVDLKVAVDGSLYYLARGGGAVYRVRYDGAPAIASHPASQTVPVGGSATFAVRATGAPPLSYQWLRDDVEIPGAALASYTISNAQLSDSGARFRCRVRNSFDSIESNDAVLTVSNNKPPVPTITAPTVGSRYNGGSTILFAGTALDPDDTLTAAAFSWTVVFHHDTHTHPFLGPVNGVTGSSFQIPTAGETSANVFYRIHLTVTDPHGAQGSTHVDILPNVVTLALQTDPPGIGLTLDGQPVTTPFSVPTVAGVVRTIGAPSAARVGKVSYSFSHWSDSGAQTHSVTPLANTTYTAVYRRKTRR